MSAWFIVLPVLLPLISACACAFSYRSQRVASWFSSIGALLTLFSAIAVFYTVQGQGIQVTAFGSWAAPFGIVFVADTLAASLVLITAIIGVAVVFYSLADLKQHHGYSLYQAMMQVLLAGVAGSFLTGDIFNLYVWFEVMLISAFGLMMLNAKKPQVEATVKYAVLNLISTLVLLLAIGLLYGATGTLNLADLHSKVQHVPEATQMIIAGLFFFGFAIKGAFFPLYSWLPASYPFLPSTVVALFAALLSKVGVYAMMRMFTLVFTVPGSGYQGSMLVIAGLTMFTGVIGAASQFHIKRILSFHIISQIGYMLMGLAIFTPLAITGAIFYIIHHIIVKANLFLIGGYLEKLFASDNLYDMGGMYKSMPLLAFLFLIPAFALSGFPPFSGFWGKLFVIKASLQTQHYLLAATALLVGLITIFSMSKIWNMAFWQAISKPQINTPITRIEKIGYLAPIISLSAISLLIGLMAEPIYQVAAKASDELLNPKAYIDAVLSIKNNSEATP